MATHYVRFSLGGTLYMLVTASWTDTAIQAQIRGGTRGARPPIFGLAVPNWAPHFTLEHRWQGGKECGDELPLRELIPWALQFHTRKFHLQPCKLLDTGSEKQQTTTGTCKLSFHANTKHKNLFLSGSDPLSPNVQIYAAFVLCCQKVGS